MAKDATNTKLQEAWNRLVLFQITRPLVGWEREFRKITRRKAERLAAQEDEREQDG